MEFLLFLVTFSQSPQGVYLQHVASFGAMHECVTFSELHNQLAESPDEILTCVKVDLETTKYKE